MIELSFFPIDIDYVDREIKAEIRIFGKTDDGKIKQESCQPDN